MNKEQLETANGRLMALRQQMGITTAQPRPPATRPTPGSTRTLKKNSITFSGCNEKWRQFDWDRHPALPAAKRLIVDWYNGLPASGALVVAGNVGCGKTHLAQAIYDVFGHWQTSFFGEIALAKAIQRTYDDRYRSEDSFFQDHLFRSRLFVLDDLGAYQAKAGGGAWLQNIYHVIFNDYLTVGKRPLLITTNLPLMSKQSSDSVQSRIGNRCFSRLCGAMGGPQSYINLFKVSDYRIEQFMQGQPK